jgi:TDG/mug DNA glycosylase family protein
MPHVHSFPPVEESDARVLVLGSMPSVMSLRKRQYYAHPRNAFWKIMGELVGAGPDLEYESRCETLKSCGIALWDVLKCCTRAGSLDSRIDDSTMETNDLLSFFRVHPRLEHIYFNGAKAEQIYCQKIEPLMSYGNLHYERLPSTSPANAAATFADKLRAWQVIVR